MEALMALLVGCLYAAGFYMLVRRSILKLLMGITLLSHASHLLIFASAGLVRAKPPLLAEGTRQMQPPFADPLPQALVLTAIVISFGLLAFGLAVAVRIFEEGNQDDVDALPEEGES